MNENMSFRILEKKLFNFDFLQNSSKQIKFLAIVRIQRNPFDEL